jgi:hypothetical protein
MFPYLWYVTGCPVDAAFNATPVAADDASTSASASLTVFVVEST